MYTWHTLLHYPHGANAGCDLAGVAPVVQTKFNAGLLPKLCRIVCQMMVFANGLALDMDLGIDKPCVRILNIFRQGLN